ncbi:MAG: SDR family oxidoreductase, partial [Gaiellaceae bacterium]
EGERWQVVAAGRADGDLSTVAGAQELVANAVARLGGLDLVVHAAADGFVPKPVDEVTEADWDAAADVTAKGTFFLAQAAHPHLRESRGVLILLEDVAAYQPWVSFAPHCAAKAAQAMLTRLLAKAFAPEVRVCGIAPGPVAVDEGQEERRAAETLLGRTGSPDDVAAAVSYLAGAGYITGSTLFVDGGRNLQSGRRPRA